MFCNERLSQQKMFLFIYMTSLSFDQRRTNMRRKENDAEVRYQIRTTNVIAFALVFLLFFIEKQIVLFSWKCPNFLRMKLRWLKTRKRNLFLFVLRQVFARKLKWSWNSLCGAGCLWIHILSMEYTDYRIFSIATEASVRQVHFSVLRCVFALILVDLGDFKPCVKW